MYCFGFGKYCCINTIISLTQFNSSSTTLKFFCAFVVLSPYAFFLSAELTFPQCHINVITQYITFEVWLLSLNASEIHRYWYIYQSCLLLLNDIQLYECIIFHLSIYNLKTLGFQFLVIVKKAAINIHRQVCVSTWVFFVLVHT